MSLVDPRSLAITARNINLAHLLGHEIKVTDANEAWDWLRARYLQAIPDSVLKARRPNPRWANIPKSFALTEADRKSKPRPLTGEALDNAAMRMCHSREAARAQFILGQITGRRADEALELCAGIRATGDSIAEGRSGKKPFF